MPKVLSWGKCTINVEPISGTGCPEGFTAMDFPTPVEDSTNLTTTQGDKNEAKVEGGGVEAVRYNANSYELAFQIRLHSTLTTPPLNGTDGVINGEYKVTIKPENSSAPQVVINRASANVGVEFTADNGLVASYTFSSLVVENGNQITIGAGS